LNTTTPLSASHQRAVGIYFFSLWEGTQE
jgi:hypothetical protein